MKRYKPLFKEGKVILNEDVKDTLVPIFSNVMNVLKKSRSFKGISSTPPSQINTLVREVYGNDPRKLEGVLKTLATYIESFRNKSPKFTSLKVSELGKLVAQNEMAAISQNPTILPTSINATDFQSFIPLFFDAFPNLSIHDEKAPSVPVRGGLEASQ
jgi:hypothetical protein